MEFGGRFGGFDLQAAHLEKREILAVHQQSLLSERDRVARLRLTPNRGSPETYRIVGMTEAEGRKGWNQHFAQFRTPECRSGLHKCRDPQQIAQSLRSLDLYRCDVRHWQPHILAGGE